MLRIREYVLIAGVVCLFCGLPCTPYFGKLTVQRHPNYSTPFQQAVERGEYAKIAWVLIPTGLACIAGSASVTRRENQRQSAQLRRSATHLKTFNS